MQWFSRRDALSDCKHRAILHDDEAYENPLSFNPDRFIKDGRLNTEIRDPATAAFGFGRRSVQLTNHHFLE